MFFKSKPATPSQPTAPPQGWKNCAGPSQQFWISVASWDYKVFPQLTGRGQPECDFQFEGTILSGEPLIGLAVAGSIEVVTLEETTGGRPDHWRNTPAFMEGTGNLLHQADSALQPFVGVTLYVNQQTVDWVYRAFSGGQFSGKGGLGIKVTIDCPDADGDDFWEERWRTKLWRVARWGVFAGSRPHQP